MFTWAFADKTCIQDLSFLVLGFESGVHLPGRCRQPFVLCEELLLLASEPTDSNRTICVCLGTKHKQHHVCLPHLVFVRCFRWLAAMAPRLKQPMKKKYNTILQTCMSCGTKLRKGNNEPSACSIYGSEGVEPAQLLSKRCPRFCCRTIYRPNFYWENGLKMNCLSFNQMEKVGIYFVSDSVAFSFPYLELTYLRLLRGKLAIGQEAAVTGIYYNQKGDKKDVLKERSMRDNLLHALEGFALARRTPDDVVKYDLNYPSSIFNGNRDAFLFYPESKITALAFDGHFGVHRELEPGVDADRTVRRRGKPRYQEHERTATCKHKHKTKKRVPMGNRTCGWQFVLDPKSQMVLGAMEHLQNETIPEKVDVVSQVLQIENVEPDLLIHDDCCRFEKYIKDRDLPLFNRIKYFVIDEFHQKNHKCAKKKWTTAEKKRLEDVPTNTCEMFNSWIRQLNHFLNSLRFSSHRFWVQEALLFWNEHNVNLHRRFSRRTRASRRAASRSR